MEFRDLSRADTQTPTFMHLLWLSDTVDDESLRKVRDDELPGLSLIGATEGGELLGFLACDTRPATLVIEYIATAEARHGTGLGTALIRELQRRHPGREIFAQTDDDAIGFYRRIGFVDQPAPPDLRWPDRPRYDCVLSAPH